MKAHISQRLNVNPAAVCHCIVGYRPHSILCKSRYIPFTILDIWEYAPKHCWEKKWERVLARLELSTRLFLSCNRLFPKQDPHLRWVSTNKRWDNIVVPHFLLLIDCIIAALSSPSSPSPPSLRLLFAEWTCLPQSIFLLSRNNHPSSSFLFGVGLSLYDQNGVAVFESDNSYRSEGAD